ncbi:uracil-DNA glycosylase [Qipengyuania qiaonensis]|uniref:Uracil-DNA glycosylase n=1 Tax=Qipengyuania qiaonensis TaxID=2867240 RepID=A0ABS7J3Y3_9SPHN|nr:uracil-DNA glycosylase [Qipengyuania qiaonensis]MBX7482030.1 uracil-DNA glycosylase [Qipengyuania qiaonensis]
MTPKTFVSALAAAKLPSVFNPWRDRCSIHDRRDAAARRRSNLQGMLEAALDAHVETIWIARDLGYRGGRRTGVPLTDEVHLTHASALMGGIALERATQGPEIAERTAAIVWQVLGRIGQPVMLWNVFPFHPHEADDPMSNRCHSRAEREATWPLLQALVSMVQPRRIVAIGRDAHLALAELDTEVTAIRHPSYGGQREFIDGMYGLYGIADDPVGLPELPLGPRYAATAKALA